MILWDLYLYQWSWGGMCDWKLQIWLSAILRSNADLWYLISSRWRIISDKEKTLLFFLSQMFNVSLGQPPTAHSLLTLYTNLCPRICRQALDLDISTVAERYLQFKMHLKRPSVWIQEVNRKTDQLTLPSFSVLELLAWLKMSKY